MADIANVGAWADFFDAGSESLGGGFNHLFDGRIALATYKHRESAIGIIALIEDNKVERGFVAFL